MKNRCMKPEWNIRKHRQLLIDPASKFLGLFFFFLTKQIFYYGGFGILIRGRHIWIFHSKV